MIRVAFIGLGYRGRYLHQLMQSLEGVEVVGLADPWLRAEDCPEGVRPFWGESGYEAMLEECQPHLVVVASPWHLHERHTLAALDAGADVALEIGGGSTLGQYDAIAKRTRQLGRKVYPLENAVFMRSSMAVGEMIRRGVFGDLISLSGGYRHDLRHLLAGAYQPQEEGQTGLAHKWRTHYYTTTNADLYPTHGLGPISLFASLGREDRLCRLYATSSRALGLEQYLGQRGLTTPRIKTGDVITTLLTTERGVLLRLTHDTTLPRPRSLDYEVQGTRAIWQGEHRRIYIDGVSPREQWEDDSPYLIEYDHPLWRKWGAEALRYDQHHQGMDYVMLRCLIADLQGEAVYPITLSDLALWSSITPLSAQSIATGQALQLPSPSSPQ